MKTIAIKRKRGAYHLSIPDMSCADLVLLMQVTEKTIPGLSWAIRNFIETELRKNKP